MQKENLFTVYKSSAGSGKTFTLTREYLKLAFQNADHFKKILAVTFTNKATQEMKERIIHNLYEFSKSEPSVMSEQLKSSLGFTDQVLQKKSHQLLVSILHNYSRFSVQTIDRFFQNVMRSFARELSLQGDGELLLNTEEVRQSVLDLLMEDISEPQNAALRSWLLDFSINKLEEKGKWDVRRDILSFTQELMKDDFKIIEKALNVAISDYTHLKDFKDKLNKIVAQFENGLDKISREALLLIESKGLSFDDFSGKGSSAPNFFNKISKEKRNYDLSDLVNKTVARAIDSGGESMATKTSEKRAAIIQLAEGGLIDYFHHGISYIQNQLPAYRSAENILRNIYLLGITWQFNHRMQEYKKEEGIQFLSDTTQFLNEIIGTDPAESPFVYEKMGSFYEHFLMDEFQDTSTLQWQNFRPLIENSLAEGHENLVVGDVKQSIYRWRGGDWRLLLKQLKEDIPAGFYQENELTHNFRSKPNVIDFNNNLFSELPNLVRSYALNKSTAFSLDYEHFLDDLAEAYKEVVQNKKKDYPYGGFVEIQFFENAENEAGEKISWNEQALAKFVSDLELLQDAGINLQEVGILIRKKSEGIQIQDYLENYKIENPAKAVRYQYNIISDETLMLSGAHIVNFLLNCFQYLYTGDKIALAQIKFYYRRIINGKDVPIHEIVKFDGSDEYLPDKFLNSQKELVSLSLLEMSEQLIQIFKLKEIQQEKAYLSAFQDVLLDFGNKGGIPDFLEWWEQNQQSYAIKLQSGQNAARMMTIHKAKGLEFRICMIPLLDWTLIPAGVMAPILWVKTEGTQFSEVPYLPVKQTSSLKDSLFADSYWEEEVKSYLDNMNLLYVALTRAGDALIVNTAANAKGSYISNLLQEFSENQVDNWDVDLQKLTVGDTSDFTSIAEEAELDKKKKEISSLKSVDLSFYESHNWQDRLQIKHSNSLLNDESGLSRTDFGIYVHDLLASLNTLDELPILLEKLKADKMLNDEDFAKVEKNVKDNLQTGSKLLHWFDTDWEVKTEVPVLLPDGSLIRLDRVLIKNNDAQILDFKTGQKVDKDNKQLNFYKNTLKKMGYNKVTAHLAYLNPLEIVEV
jgi:ATP-dependent exoDNAse (exonuclease V) beta subunit